MQTNFSERVEETNQMIKKANMCKHCLATATKKYGFQEVCENHYKTFVELDRMGSDY